MKRRFAILLTSILLISVLAACTSSSSGEADGGKTIVVGIDDKFAPMGFRDEKNEIVGFDIDLAKAVIEKMGATPKFQPIDWKTKESELSSGRIDLIWNGYTITDERKEKVLFTKPYLSNAQVAVTLTDSDLIELSDLEGKVVGLQSLSSAADALNDNKISSKVKEITEFSDNVMALSDLKNGRLDAVIIDEIVIDYYMTKEKDTFKILDESLAPEEYGIGVKKGNAELLEDLQTALDELIENGAAGEISEKWFGEDRLLK
ncbi:amino acid ABC transporter substrate-binding protein [Cytobacillus purgationiresistens]|uniref:Polar amino acid transport system substrate-binding protein n=1 Tax=Cytobacillus purgationiresistens TaxID=863449 RepID=A0ABU0AQ45_9BACI|nr:amino acid ABC transporter substrate-binding protein [Cytobacillus purgationiresistens]MDQ0273406.1 polar amino acid transport system substrate-binding protein [Cytobacillus purgationiresistens]